MDLRVSSHIQVIIIWVKEIKRMGRRRVVVWGVGGETERVGVGGGRMGAK